MLVRRISRIIFDKRALNNVISATILTAVVITLSLVVFGWAQSRSSDYNSEFSETVDAETARLKEKLVFEHKFYDNSSDTLEVFLLNCGTIDGIKIQTVFIYDSSSTLIVSNPILYSFQSLDEISGQVLDKGDEGRLVMELSSSLSGFCNIRLVTVRGATFDSEFVA